MNAPSTLPRRRAVHVPRARAIALALAAALPLLLAACGGRPPSAAPVPVPLGTGLPPVPLVEGPLAVRFVYPLPNQLVETRDSNFVLGSVGNGRATLDINGVRVPVAPNGTFLAWLPVPGAARPVYDVVARVGADSARDSLPIRVPAPRPVLDSARYVDSASVSPRGGGLALRPDETVRVSVRAIAGASAWVEWDTTRAAGGPPPTTTIAPATRSRTTTQSRVVPPPRARRALVAVGAEQLAGDVRAEILARGATLVVQRGADTARFTLGAPEIVDPAAPRFVRLGGDSVTAPDSDRTIPARPVPAGGYAWALLPGTMLEMTGRQGAFTRVRLDAALEVWVDSADAGPAAIGSPAPRRSVGAFNLVPGREWVDVQIPIGERPAYLVEEQGSTLVLTLYGTRVAPGLVRYLGNDSLVRYTVWTQETSDRARLTLQLPHPAYGYLVLYDRGTFTLRVRRPPTVNPARPLAGLTIAVDAGHPPGGATGPGGLTEAEAVLPVADRVKTLLEARGATVVRIRTTPEAMALGLRPVLARRANAHAFVSVHLNALGDGANPFTNNGSSVLYYHPQAEPLARALERELTARLGLRDLGVHFQNIAIGRTTWMPSVITEGLFLMIPEQEAAMRTDIGRERYAHAIADGVEAYFRGLARP